MGEGSTAGAEFHEDAGLECTDHVSCWVVEGRSSFHPFGRGRGVGGGVDCSGDSGQAGLCCFLVLLP